MLTLILSVIIIGIVIWILQGAPLDAFVKRIIYGLCIIWLILVLAAAFGIVAWPAPHLR
jgi:uncharacterized membrane protein YwzB